MKKTVLSLLCFMVFIALTLNAELIPSDRLITWNPGVRGGVPSVTTMFCDVTVSIPGTNRTAIGNGTAEDYLAIQTALNLCPSNQYVYLPVGSYRITNELSMVRNGVVLRGAGTNSILRFAGTVNVGGISVGNNDSPISTNDWTSGYTKGTTSITVSSASGLAVGDVIILAHTNNVIWPDTNGTADVIASTVNNTSGESTHCGYDGGHSSMGQMVEIQTIDGTTLTILPPLHNNYTNGSQHMWRMPATTDKVGVESLTIIPFSAAEYCSKNLIFSLTKNCWATNVWLREASYVHLWVTKSLWFSFKHNWLEGQLDNDYGSGAGYGMTTFQYTTASLFEDNVITRCLNSAVLQVCSGNVYGYNFATNNIGPGSDPFNRMTFGFGNHGAHPHMNLFEGNKENAYFDDYIHGSSSHELLFRNWFRGWATNTVSGVSTSVVKYAICAVQFAWWNRYPTVVGNVLGTEGITTWGGAEYQHTMDVTGYDDFASPSIYRFGYYNSTQLADPYDDRVLATVIRKGNAVATNGGNWTVTANESLGVDTLPNSYYLLSKPSWFGNYTWPPIGSDLTPKVNIIPAEARYLGMNEPIIPTIYTNIINTVYGRFGILIN